MREIPPAGAPIRDIITAINQLIRGRSNAALEVTLAAGTTTTTVSHQNINENSMPVLSPKTANAAAAVGTTYATVPTAGTILITHASAATTDRTFYLHIHGG